jgi:hypothetical protein
VKKRDLERHLLAHGCRLIREGAGHEMWENPVTTSDQLCRAIARSKRPRRAGSAGRSRSRLRPGADHACVIPGGHVAGGWQRNSTATSARNGASVATRSSGQSTPKSKRLSARHQRCRRSDYVGAAWATWFKGAGGRAALMGLRPRQTSQGSCRSGRRTPIDVLPDRGRRNCVRPTAGPSVS